MRYRLGGLSHSQVEPIMARLFKLCKVKLMKWDKHLVVNIPKHYRLLNNPGNVLKIKQRLSRVETVSD